MSGRNSMVIAPNKSKEFKKFLTTHGKGKDFWAKNKQIANTKFDKGELLALFNDEGKHQEMKIELQYVLLIAFWSFHFGLWCSKWVEKFVKWLFDNNYL